MKVGDQFFSSGTLLTQDNPDVMYYAGTVLTLKSEMPSTDLFIGVDDSGRRFVVGPHNGRATDVDVHTDLFRVAVGLGYTGDPEYFAKGYNRIVELQLKKAIEGLRWCTSSGMALDQAEHFDECLAATSQKDVTYAQLKASRDAYLHYAEVLEKVERLVLQYKKESAEANYSAT